ncbi:MAG: carboxypeptidase regulatory-like domain-containing protein, partial [Acidobacteriota bacterium]
MKTLAKWNKYGAMLLLTACVAWGQIDRGTIQGVVTDSAGLVLPETKVQVIGVDTNSTTELATNGEGLYTAPNLPAGNYRIVFQKTGFRTSTREPVEVRPRQAIRVDVTLQVGSVSESVTVTDQAPLLDTATMNNAAGFKQDQIQNLPVIVVGTKRDVTAFINNLPGTSNSNTFTPSVNGAPTGKTETFVDGAPASQRIMVGAFSENGPMIEQVGEVSVVANAFNAEYGGFGNWFTNVTIRSGTNRLHGSVFDHLGNDKLNARSFFQPRRTPYRQNEGGFTLGGPLVIPGVYNGKDKTFFFGSLGVFYSRYGASGNIITIPTREFLNGDFSALRNAAGQIPIFDPTTSAPDGNGSVVRTQFVGNVIPATRISQIGKTVAQYMPAPTLPGIVNNFNSKAAATWPFYNTFVPLLKIDHSLSSKQKLSGSYTYQKRPRIIWSGGMTDAPAWGQSQTNPLDNVFDQIANSWRVRLNHDYVLSPTVINHLTLSLDRYYNRGLNKTNGQGWDQKLGITGIPADTGAFPQINFSGGAVSPAQLNRGYDENWRDVRYSIIENLTMIHGKHTIKAGFEIDRDRINRRFLGGAQGIFTFTNSLTSQPNSPNFGTWGNSYASFLLGAVGTSLADIQPTWGARFIRYGLFVQDEWQATRNLSISYGLRWDYNPPASEVQDKISSFQPYLANPAAGGRLGALAFIGSGAGRIGGNFQDGWKKGFGPRLGITYLLHNKTVIRASAGINYAVSGNSAVPPTAGFSNTPSFSSPDGYTPLYYLESGTFPQSFQRPPALDPSFSNGLAISFIPRTGTRLPQTVNYTFGIQREIMPNTTIEANYIGYKSTHQGLSTNYNYMPLDNLKYGNLLLQPITSTAASQGGFISPFAAFASQRGANTVYQSLRPYPQYTAVTTGGGVFFGGGQVSGVADPVGQNLYNSLQVKGTHRFSNGLSLFGFATWSKSFTLIQDQYPGVRLFQQDVQPAFSYSFSWTYDLPFGRGKMLNPSSRAVNAVVAGWRINGFVKYSSGVPLSVAGGAGNLGAVGYGQRGNAVPGVSPYLVTNPADFDPATSRYLNAAAFTTSTGFNFGNLAPTLSWARGFWDKQEALTIGRTFRINERFSF